MEVASAQVKSAILFASLFSKEPTIIKELDVSRNHTETMFKHFNIPIEAEGLSITTTPDAIQHIKPADFHVPGDISSAAFFIVAALIGNMVRKPVTLIIWKHVFCMKLSLRTFRHTQRPL